MTTILLKKNARLAHPVRSGLTVLEVLFAMAVLLIGLLGVAFMIPLAGRQADSSVATTQGLAVGENALEIFKAQSISHPRMDVPWQIIDDNDYPGTGEMDSFSTWYTSFRRMYAGRQRVLLQLPQYNCPSTANAAAIPQLKINLASLQNQLIGSGFCVDPLFWGYQPRLTSILFRKDATVGYFRRTVFPYYDEDMAQSMNPLEDLGGPTFTTPRLARVSLRDPNGSDVNGNNGWLRLPAALQVSIADGGDVVIGTAETDRSLGPYRGATVGAVIRDGTGTITGGGNLIAPSTLGSNVSWMATLTPTDETPIINASSLDVRLAADGTTVIYPDITQFPDSFELSMVVFNRRDAREQLNHTLGIVPTAERLFRVTDMGPDGMTSGTFDIKIDGSSVVDARVRVGDWLMLSRYILDGVTSGSPVRQRHKWYRVISVSGDDVLPRVVRVAGVPWGWTKVEVDQLIKMNAPMSAYSDKTLLPPTVATAVKNVVQVFQRNIQANID